MKKKCEDCLDSFHIITVYDESTQDQIDFEAENETENATSDFLLCKVRCLNCDHIFLKNLDLNFLGDISNETDE